MHKPSPTPTFSIITVTYNAADVLEETLQSVVAQSYRHVEYILVDGASTDGTLALAERYRTHITHLVSRPDRGLYDAMNTGMALATGHYLCFLNAGDTFHSPDTLLLLTHTLPAAATPAALPAALPDVIYGETALVDARRHFLRMRRLSAPAVLTWRSFRHGMLVSHQAFFVRRTLAPPYDLRYRFSSDFDWCIRVMKRAHTLHNTHLILIDYLDEGLTTRNRRRSLLERFRIMSLHYGLLSTLLFHLWFVLRAVGKK